MDIFTTDFKRNFGQMTPEQCERAMQQIAEMNSKVENLNYAKEQWTEAQHLAVKIHDATCRTTDHTYTDCSFYYLNMDGSFDWSAPSRSYYLEKANSVLARVNYDDAAFMLKVIVNG